MPVTIYGRFLFGFFCAALLAGALPAHAATVSGLYEARVPITDRTPSARDAALQQALSAVLVKVTGARSVPGALTPMLADPNRYLQQYGYDQAPADPNAPAVAAGGPPALVLWAKFDPKVIDQDVTAAHVPLWGAERPSTLVWLALQDTPGGRLLAAADTSPLMQALTAAAEQRGIQLLFPQLDAVDRAALGVPDVTGFNLDRIRQASARYRPDAILVGAVTPFGGAQYAAQWQLLTGSLQDSWQTPPGDESTTAADGVQTAADRFAARYAIAADAGDLAGVPVEVDGITDLDGYAKVLAYLSGLTPVRGVRVKRLAQGDAFFSVDAHGSLDNLNSALTLGGLLLPEGSAAPTAATATTATAATVAAMAPTLRYRYSPTP